MSAPVFVNDIKLYYFFLAESKVSAGLTVRADALSDPEFPGRFIQKNMALIFTWSLSSLLRLKTDHRRFLLVEGLVSNHLDDGDLEITQGTLIFNDHVKPLVIV